MEAVVGSEDWLVEGNRWTLNAPDAGTAVLALLPLDTINHATGLSCRLRWHQNFAGSSANFTRVYWLLQADEWEDFSSFPTLPITTSTATPSDASATFLHLGETGNTDSIRWLAQSSDGQWDSLLIQPTHGGFDQGLFQELEWQQFPGSDTARITLRTVFENQSVSSSSCMAIVKHALPIGIGFSAQFTSSNATGASIEVMQFNPHQTDTVAPRVDAASFTAGTAFAFRFSEPMDRTAGIVQRIGASESIPWHLSQPKRNQIHLMDAIAWDPGTSRLYALNGFQDLQGNTMTDTLIHVYHPLNHTPPRAVIIGEFVAQASAMDDWVEIINLDSAAIDIRNLRWWDGSTNAIGALIPGLDWDGVLPPQERAVIANRWEPWMGAQPVRLAHPSVPLSLHHAGEDFGIQSAEGQIVDHVAYSSSWWENGVQMKHAQRRQLQGCTSRENWMCSGSSSSVSFGTPSLVEWPLDSFLTTFPVASLALAPGRGKTQFNQPLDTQHPPHVKNGWCWGGESPRDVHWRVDTLHENAPWHLEILGAKGCWAEHPDVHPVTLLPAHFPENGDLIITEIAHDPRGMSEAFGTFVEVYNPSTSQSIQLDGVHLNGMPLDSAGAISPRRRVCQAVSLPPESGKIRLSNHQGFTIDEVHYSRCWHTNRHKADAGFSLIRLQPDRGRIPADAAYAWDSSADLLSGCSYAAEDSGESAAWPDVDSTPFACGQLLGETVFAFSHSSFGLNGNLHYADELPADMASALAHLCPAESTAVSPGHVHLNEVRVATHSDSEPFIELRNPTNNWTSTKGVHWTSASLPFPEDWMPVHESVDWFLPPGGILAFAECPQRIQGNSVVPNPDMPSLWGSRELLLGRPEALIDSVHLHSERNAPWHSDGHSLERLTAGLGGEWKSSIDIQGHTAGRRNSWHPFSSAYATHGELAVIHDTWCVLGGGSINPVTFDMRAPDEGKWTGDWRILNALGRTVAAAPMPIGLVGEAAVRCHWDGRIGQTIAAPGAYLLLATFNRIGGTGQRQACAVVHISPG